MRRSSFDSGPAGELIAPRVITLSKLLTRLGAQYARKRFGLTRVAWQALTLLGAYQPMSIKELAELAMLDAAQVSRVVSNLQADGLVERRKSSFDSREAQLVLTSKGTSVSQELHRSALQRNALLLDGFSAEEASAAFAMLDRLIASAETQLDANERLGAD